MLLMPHKIPICVTVILNQMNTNEHNRWFNGFKWLVFLVNINDFPIFVNQPSMPVCNEAFNVTNFSLNIPCLISHASMSFELNTFCGDNTKCQ